VAAREKLIQSIRENANVRYSDACKVAEWLGFTAKGQKGSHNAFSRPGEMTILNFQNHEGKIKPYHVRQLIQMIDKYWMIDETGPEKPKRESKKTRGQK
jgi:predicted RNA binding protein YcfA (HicA-like mRNA interferase family)